MTQEEIKALTVPAADDAILFLWILAPILQKAPGRFGKYGIIWGFLHVQNPIDKSAPLHYIKEVETQTVATR